MTKGGNSDRLTIEWVYLGYVWSQTGQIYNFS